MSCLWLERIEEAGALLVGDFDGFPIEEVGGFFALDFAHEAAAGMGAGIFGRFEHGFFQGSWLPDAVGARHGQAEALIGIDVVEFQVL